VTVAVYGLFAAFFLLSVGLLLVALFRKTRQPKFIPISVSMWGVAQTSFVFLTMTGHLSKQAGIPAILIAFIALAVAIVIGVRGYVPSDEEVRQHDQAVAKMRGIIEAKRLRRKRT